jgi:hypothetical protein
VISGGDAVIAWLSLLSWPEDAASCRWVCALGDVVVPVSLNLTPLDDEDCCWSALITRGPKQEEVVGYVRDRRIDEILGEKSRLIWEIFLNPAGIRQQLESHYYAANRVGRTRQQRND